MSNIREGAITHVSNESLSQEPEDIIDFKDDPKSPSFVHVERRRVNVGSVIVNTAGGIGITVAGGALVVGLSKEALVMTAISAVAFAAARVLKKNP